MQFNGYKYTKQRNGYWYRTLNRAEQEQRGVKRISLHREVWEKQNGKIQKGFHIHHKDHNKDNNNISNLELIEEKEHLSKHTKKWHKENRPLVRR